MQVESYSDSKGESLLRILAESKDEAVKIQRGTFYKSREGLLFIFRDTEIDRQRLTAIGCEFINLIKKSDKVYKRPIFSFYTTPFTHQEEVFYETKDMEAYAYLWEMGLGKTWEALNIACYLYSADLIDQVLVVTLNGVHRNWVKEEIPKHVNPIYEYKAQYWTATKGEKAFKDFADAETLCFATVNVEALATKKGEEFCENYLHAKRTLFIVDESHAFKNPVAKRTKTLIRIRRAAKYRRIMTGTPTGGSPMDLFSQFFFLDPEIIGEKTFWSFRYKYAILQDLPSNPRVKIEVGYKNLDELKALIAPYSSRKTKKECLNLPEKIYNRHPFAMSEVQASLYKQFAKRTVAELKGKTISASIVLVKLLRLQQIACGFTVPDDEIWDDDDPIHAVPLFEPGQNPRINHILDLISQVEGKVIIWATFRMSIRELVDELIKKYGKEAVGRIDGTTSNDERDILKSRFQDPDDSLKYLVGHPQCGGTGVTLTLAQHTFYYNNSNKLIERQQSEDRVHRIGLGHTANYHDIEAIGSTDGKQIRSLASKINIASEITGDELVKWLEQGDE